MTRFRMLYAAICAGLFLLAPLPGQAAGKVVAPTPVYLPYNARIQTEINFSNDDVLGLIRDLLPAIGDLVKASASAGGPAGTKLPVRPDVLAKLDLKPLSDALKDVSNIRYIAARYKPDLAPTDVMRMFDSGAAKAGGFNRIATELSTGIGAVAVYAQAEGSGFLLYAYDSKDGQVRALRLSGRVDAAKLINWLTDTLRLFSVPTVPAADDGDAAPKSE